MRKIIYASLLGCAILCGNKTFAQEKSESTKKFTNADRKFRDWSISVFGGGSLLQNADLQSFGETSGFLPGYDLQFLVNKQITHAFGLSVGYTYGSVRGKGRGRDESIGYIPGAGSIFHSKTEYQGISLFGDVNFSNLLRRVDNDSPFRWALHGYAGVGILDYKAKIKYPGRDSYITTKDTKFDARSFYAQVGGGLRYKISNSFDAELKAMYVMTGDEEFDGSGAGIPGKYTVADWEEGRDDNYVTLSLGLHYKIGKHKDALQWYDPLQNVQPGIPVAAEAEKCVDDDNDGVCDFLDKCLNTPAGLKVDGSGCTLDTDGDNVPDSEDQCPTIPGPLTNQGCPIPYVEISKGKIADILTEKIQGIEFDYNSDKIRTVSYTKLDDAANILQAHPTYKFYVEGHTDAAGSVTYNQGLSERRAASVVKYLVNKGVNADQLSPRGKGKTDLKHPECDPTSNCPAWKNLENRRVIFIDRD